MVVVSSKTREQQMREIQENRQSAIERINYLVDTAVEEASSLHDSKEDGLEYIQELLNRMKAGELLEWDVTKIIE